MLISGLPVHDVKNYLSCSNSISDYLSFIFLFLFCPVFLIFFYLLAL